MIQISIEYELLDKKYNSWLYLINNDFYVFKKKIFQLKLQDKIPETLAPIILTITLAKILLLEDIYYAE